MDDDPNALSVANQRTLFLVNTFVIHTVRLLNNFSVICEDKLADVHRRILRADATLYLLEAKLRSVDGLEGAGEQMPLDTLPDLVLPAPAVESSFEPEGSSSSHCPRQGLNEVERTRQLRSPLQIRLSS
ncbi:WASH complex subunit CCDC53 [Marchantia polymorpha subsp. ruderalis]|uniref:WASH complex subunit 3 n=1 Tax=Marchantia polymorpha TaxID=3197 RepID=A0A2R6XGY2_MARPO|nr:hypothetical protein MARPO_0015s0155 [Marchantia polymorpha]BBN01600.1 hypothetical protein Mp_2g08700 [Marchantia polymorpha subsp. ruderalis]|eukprot:PTQ45366.1 hypothetical protein MARPO_0015s0155 [Marchantia polymorpha]